MANENTETSAPQPESQPVAKPEAPKPKPARVTIKLEFPIKIGGTATSTLTMRRPKVRDRMTVSQLGVTEEQKDMNMIANLCEITPEDVGEIDLSDYSKVMDALMGFIMPQTPPSKEQS